MRSPRCGTALRGALVLLATPSFQALAQGLPRARPEDVGLSSAALQAIAADLQHHVDAGKVAGAIALVARHGRLAYVGSVGSLTPGHPTPVDVDAVFRIYSMTKPITTVAVMQLVERGLVRLDDPVSKYIPAFAHARVYDGGGALHPQTRALDRPVTIAHLLTHTAGLTYGPFGGTPVDSIYMRAGLFGAQLTLQQLADSLAHLPLLFQPGTRWNYSFALDVLARVVEVASRTRFDRYVDSAITRPLGMRSTAFHATTPTMQARLTTIYARGTDGTLVPLQPLLAPEYTAQGKMLSGGAGLLSTAADYLRFSQMLLNGGELDGRRVLRPESVTLMMRNELPAAITPIPAFAGWPPGAYGFGYGGAVRVDSEPAIPGHAGTFRWSGYGSTFFWIDPAADLIAMIWTQYLPGTDMFWLDMDYQRLVYAAVREPALVQAGREDASAGLRAQVARFQDAWNAHDAAAVAAFFTRDADQIVDAGALVTGRDALARWWSSRFASMERGRRITLRVTSVRLLAPDVALVNTLATTGGTGPGGGALRPDADRGTWVVVREDGQWRLAALRVVKATQ